VFDEILVGYYLGFVVKNKMFYLMTNWLTLLILKPESNQLKCLYGIQSLNFKI
jgi:hypothetical protein